MITRLYQWLTWKCKRLSVHVAWFWMRHLPHPWDILWLCWVLKHASWFVTLRSRGSR